MGVASGPDAILWLHDRLRSDEQDNPTIEVIRHGIRMRKPIRKCKADEIAAYADRCEFEARRAREYLAQYHGKRGK
jgi:hypothetical protein